MSGSTQRVSELIDQIKAAYNGEQVSEWFAVDQRDIDRFSEATHDPDWMHIDPERARREGPFGGTVAFGFWTMSMLTYFARQASGREYPEGVKFALNYGFDRVRLMAPVSVGKRIRNRARLVSVEDRGDGRVVVKTENTVEVEGADKPAMIAEWLSMLFVA